MSWAVMLVKKRQVIMAVAKMDLLVIGISGIRLLRYKGMGNISGRTKWH